MDLMVSHLGGLHRSGHLQIAVEAMLEHIQAAWHIYVLTAPL